MKDNDKNKRKELAAKQKFHEDMMLGSKFIQDWYLFPRLCQRMGWSMPMMNFCGALPYFYIEGPWH